MVLAVVAHGGAGSKPELRDGVLEGVRQGVEALKKGSNALDAVIAGAVVLENDVRFNAGWGSVATLDGEIEMDASLMTSRGEIGGVIGLRRVRNPIKVARLVMDTPHIMLCGIGAELFAREHGIPAEEMMSPKAQERLKSIRQRLRSRNVHPYAKKWKDYDLLGYYRNIVEGDTIGVVALDEEGYIAVANSTGGISYKLRGRVGDTPQVGSGLWAGPEGGVAATGIGEEITRNLLSYRVYEAFASGRMSVQEACEWGVSLLDKEIPTGVIALDRKGNVGIACNTKMAVASHLDLEE